MGKRFLENKKKGNIWEAKMQEWLHDRFADSNWSITDTRDQHRDSDNDQVPDYLLYNKVSERSHYIDAKKRNVYTIRGTEYFGFDEKFYQSYTNIARKHNMKVYVGFNDPDYDSEHVYILDVDQTPSLKLHFDNEHGKSFAYRWRVTDLKKYKI